MTKYPEIEVQLTGQDGNAFNILALVSAGLKANNISSEEQKQFQKEAMSGDYDNLLDVCCSWVTVS